MTQNFEKPNRLEEVEKKLNSPTEIIGIRDRKPLRPKEYETPRDWQQEHEKVQESSMVVDSNKPNWFFRFFIVAFIFFLGALGFLGYRLFFDSGINATNVDILVNAPLTVGAGEILDFEVVTQNRNQVGMRYIDVEVFLPEGTRSPQDIGLEYTTIEDEIETLAVGQIIKKNYSALLFGEEGDKKEITVLLTYQIEGSTTLYKKEKVFDVVLRSTPVRLTITNIKEITSGQELVFNVELVSNSTQTLKDVVVHADYPFGFIFESSSIASGEDKRTWVVPTLAPKEVATFTIKGILEGQNNDEKFFKFTTGLRDPNSTQPQVVFSTKGTTVTLTRPFLELDFAINKDNSDIIVVDNQRSQSATISFKNNTNFPLRNATISLSLEGASLNKESVRPSNGFYQSVTDTVTWDNTTSDELEFIPVGSSGQVTLSFAGLGLAGNSFVQNPEVSAVIQVRANRNPEDQVPEIIENSIVKKIRFNTQAAVGTRSEHYTSRFANAGPIPPKAEDETTYTGVVQLRNTSSAIQNGIVRMRIPNYVEYKGMFSPNTEQVSYDTVTRMLTWNVGTIAGKTGYDGIASRDLAIQFSLVPSVSQVGTAPVIAENIKLTGVDAHTQKEINLDGLSITTAIVDAKETFDSRVSR